MYGQAEASEFDHVNEVVNPAESAYQMVTLILLLEVSSLAFVSSSVDNAQDIAPAPPDLCGEVL